MKNYKAISDRHRKISLICLVVMVVTLLIFLPLQIYVSGWFTIGVILTNWPAAAYSGINQRRWKKNNDEWFNAIKAGLCNYKYNDEYIPIINRFIDRCFYADDLETYEVLNVRK